MPSDTDIWHCDSPWLWLGHLWRSRS